MPSDDLRALYLQLLRGWNNRDASAMAECFSIDGAMIGFDGSMAEGRTAIQAHLSPIFADRPVRRDPSNDPLEAATRGCEPFQM